MTQMEFQHYQERTFDAYVKRLIRNESIDARREQARQAEREISLTLLPYDGLPSLSCEDHYRLDGLKVHITGGKVTVCDHMLGEAIMSLPPKWRNVIVMYYFLDMEDQMIGKALQLTAGAIRYRRKAALERLRKTLEGMRDGE